MKTAVLQFSGTQKLRRERLTISVIEGANTSRQDFTSHVGTGSNRQEALEDSRTILHTSVVGKWGFWDRYTLMPKYGHISWNGAFWLAESVRDPPTLGGWLKVPSIHKNGVKADWFRQITCSKGGCLIGCPYKSSKIEVLNFWDRVPTICREAISMETADWWRSITWSQWSLVIGRPYKCSKIRGLNFWDRVPTSS